ncbi:MAG: hypothetical protein R3B69_02255 [Candidatus Paceibacterota bacterium]
MPLTRHIEIESFDALDDERRLFYVALTRARKPYTSPTPLPIKPAAREHRLVLSKKIDAYLRTNDVAQYEADFDPTYHPLHRQYRRHPSYNSFY